MPDKRRELRQNYPASHTLLSVHCLYQRTATKCKGEVLGWGSLLVWFGVGRVSSAPSGLIQLSEPTHGLRRGLHSFAASRLRRLSPRGFWQRRRTAGSSTSLASLRFGRNDRVGVAWTAKNKIKNKIKSNINGSGQECPPHLGASRGRSRFWRGGGCFRRRLLCGPPRRGRWRREGGRAWLRVGARTRASW